MLIAPQSFVPLLATKAGSVDHGGMRGEIGVIEITVFVFRSKRNDRLRLLAYDGSGMVLARN